MWVALLKLLQKINFSDITNVELRQLGVVVGWLDFNVNKLDKLAERLTPKARIEIPQLQSRILDILQPCEYGCTSTFSLSLPVILL